MSMTREAFITHVENDHFSAILDEINKPKSSLSEKRFIEWFKDGYLISNNQTPWINLLKHLNHDNQKMFKVPTYLAHIFSTIIENIKPKQQAEIDFDDEKSLFDTNSEIEESEADKLIYHENITKCVPLLTHVFNQLISSKYTNLMNNYLFEFQQLLISQDTHKDILNVIEKMNPGDKDNAYQALLSLYLINPDLLYHASKMNPHIINSLKSTTLDEKKSFFIERMEQLFETEDKTNILMICRYLKDIENNNINSQLNTHINSADLFKLKKISTQSYDAIEKLIKLFRTDNKAQTILGDFIKNSDDLSILNFTNQLFPFLNGFGYFQLKEGLLTCAQINSRKKYLFNPVLLADNDEFEKFLHLVKNYQTEHRIRFIITGDHWIAGEIQTTGDNHAKIAIYDSLGATEKQKMYFLQNTTLQAMEIFNNNFPSDAIYFCPTKRQHAKKCCAIFALDDTAHSFRVETYLKKDIFDYYDAQPTASKQITIQNTEKLNIHQCALPLSLFRTTQSLTTIDQLKQNTNTDTLNLSVNKKGDKFSNSVSLLYKPVAPDSKKQINPRLQHQLDKFAMQAALYYLTHDAKTVKYEMSQFELKAFEDIVKTEHKTPNTLR